MSRKKVAQLYLLKRNPTFIDHLVVWLSLIFGGKKKRGEKRG